jgi:predicted esterase
LALDAQARERRGIRRGLRFAAALAAVGLLGLGCHAPPGGVQPVPSPGIGEVVLPPDYDPGHAYPVVEILPATGSTAATLLQMFLVRVGLGRYADEPPERQVAELRPYLFPGTGRARRGVILILARGRGSSDDYRTPQAWARTIARYERQVLADLSAVAATHRVDTARQVVAGFSLGGDLSWAIALRHPQVLRGAIVMASRVSYRPDRAEAGAVARAGVRFFLTMGDADDRIRQRMAREAAETLDSWGVPHRLEILHGAGHEPAPPDVFARALDFVLAP